MGLEKMALQMLSHEVPGIKRGDFNKTVISKIKEWGNNEEAPEIEEDLKKYQVYPDSYMIDDENRCVNIYEVEDHYKLTAAKLNKYIGIFWALDSVCVGLVIWIVNRYGHIVHGLDPLEVMCALHEKK